MTNSQKIESDCRQKLQKLDSEYQQKLIPYNFTGREGLPGLPDPVISGTHTAESQAKGEAIQREYHRKRAAIVAERDARLADEHNRTQKQDCAGKIGRPT